ncbi:MAG: cytidylate kinase-like family protein [Bacteroidota bacterium]
MSKQISQMIEEQVRSWMIKSSSSQPDFSQSRSKPIITISREYGAKGAALAALLGQQLNFTVWDKDLLQVISNTLGNDPEFLAKIDERKRNAVEDMVMGFINNPGTNLNYLITLTKTLKAIERLGNSLIVGRGANYICTQPSSFHVRVVCPLPTRIARIGEKEHLTRDKARQLIQQKDEERTYFSLYHFKRDCTDPRDYHMILNSERFNLEEMARLVTEAYEVYSQSTIWSFSSTST